MKIKLELEVEQVQIINQLLSRTIKPIYDTIQTLQEQLQSGLIVKPESGEKKNEDNK